MTIASDLAAGRQYIRDVLATITVLAGCAIDIKSAAGKQTESPLDAVDSALPKAWVYSTAWSITYGPVIGTGHVKSPVSVDIWFPLGQGPGSGEEWETVLGAVVETMTKAKEPARTIVRFAGDCSGEQTAARRAILRMPMTIDVTFSLR